MEKVKEAFAEFEKPSIAVDTVILRVMDSEEVSARQVANKQIQVLLVKKPSETNWHLPGTILRLGETPRDAIERIASDKIDVSNIHFEQLYTLADDIYRDERGHIISIVYIGMGLLNEDIKKSANSEYEYQWFWVFKADENNKNRRYVGVVDFNNETELMYDHSRIVDDTIQKLSSIILESDIGFNFVGKEFTIKELEKTFNAINERDIPGFRRYIEKKVKGTGKMSDGKYFRPAELFVKK